MLTCFRSNKLHTLEELQEAVARQILRLPQMISPVGQPLKIARFEFPISSMDFFSWLHNQSFTEKIYWSDRKNTFEMAGAGVADVIEGDQKSEDVFSAVEDRISADNIYLRYYGGFSFDKAGLKEGWDRFPQYRFIVPRFELFQTKERCYFAFNIKLADVQEEQIKNILEAFKSINFSPQTQYRNVPIVQERSDRPDFATWQNMLTDLEKMDKVVLARQSTFEFDRAINPIALLKHLKDITPNCFHFCIQLDDHYGFLGASPEQLFKREALNIESEALAGTVQRGETQHDDTKLEEQLLNSPKDTKEHKYVVDEIYDCLTHLCSSFEQDSKFSLVKLKEGQHLCTKFKGQLKSDVSDDQILSLLHPTPAVCGTPKKEAQEMIAQIEPFSRGWYAGPIGYVGADCCEFAVGIRSCLVNHEKIAVYAGAGIIEESLPKNEWDEIEIKIGNFMRVFKQ